MRQEFVIGLTVSALLHGGVFLQGILFPSRPPTPPPPPPKEVLPIVDMPRLDEEPEVIKPSDEPAEPVTVAPPSIVDVPQVPKPDSFVQPLQPPLPDNIKPDVGIGKIPEVRNPGRIKQMAVFDPATLDQQPVPRVRTPPPYPPEMRRLGLTGQVIVDFIVDSNGDVQNAYALQSTQREFESAAVQAVSRWKFKAGRKGGRAVNTHMQVPVVFNLDDN